MTILELLLLLLVAGICGAIGQAIVGYSRGGCLVAIALGFIGALVGSWIARASGPARDVCHSVRQPTLSHLVVDYRSCGFRGRLELADPPTARPLNGTASGCECRIVVASIGGLIPYKGFGLLVG